MNRDLNLKEMLLFFLFSKNSLKNKQANKQILLTMTVIEILPWIFIVLQIYDRCSAQLIKNSDIELKHIKLNTLVKFEFPNKSFQYARSSLCIMIHIQLHDLIFSHYFIPSFLFHIVALCWQWKWKPSWMNNADKLFNKHWISVSLSSILSEESLEHSRFYRAFDVH